MTSSKPFNRVAWAFSLIFLAIWSDAYAQVPSPAEHFGFEPGIDRRLLSWAELCGYYRILAKTSPYISCEEVGVTTQGRPMLLLTLSSRSKAELEAVRQTQGVVASGTGFGAASAERSITELAAQPAVVYVQGTLHSTEIAASMLFPDLLYRLATGTDPLAQRIRAEVVLLVMPSANPDGIDIVNSWYAQTLGTPWEGSTPPELYQTYAGHDNNRDWYMLSLRETQVVSEQLYKRWFPEVVLDIHQMGSRGARMFVPPCSDPLNENIPALVTRQIDLVGAHMAWELQRAGCSGVVQDVVYDNYWAGGARNTPCRHNMVGIITETASAQLATPEEIAFKDLRGHGGGLPEYRRQGNFPDPWPGGVWRMSDILRYQRISTLALLDLVARHRESFVMDFYALNRAACNSNTAPTAFVISAEGADPLALSRLARVLLDTGVRVDMATAAFTWEGHALTAGSLVVSMAQPFSAHAKDLLEIQNYPEVRFTRGGEVIKPYDSAGWCLPLQFGLTCHTMRSPLAAQAPVQALLRTPRPESKLEGNGTHAQWSCTSNAAFVLANRLRDGGRPVVRAANGEFACEFQREEEIALAAHGLGLKVQLSAAGSVPHKSARPRVAIFQSWPASMDGGWTRLVLEEHGYAPVMLTAQSLAAGALGAGDQRLFDALVLPDVSAETLHNGPDAKRLPPAWQGGLAGAGVETLRAFAASGGRIIALGSSTDWLMRQWPLGVENGLAKLPKDGNDAFVCPGSLLGTRWNVEAATAATERAHWLLRSTLTPPVVYLGSASGLRVTDSKADALLHFDAANPLRSGYLEGARHLEGLAAMACCRVGTGHVILFAARPQHRSQTLGTFRLLFEALEGP